MREGREGDLGGAPARLTRCLVVCSSLSVVVVRQAMQQQLSAEATSMRESIADERARLAERWGREGRADRL